MPGRVSKWIIAKYSVTVTLCSSDSVTVTLSLSDSVTVTLSLSDSVTVTLTNQTAALEFVCTQCDFCIIKQFAFKMSQKA
jgi:hypothetical protein